jgi:hypothetical protein
VRATIHREDRGGGILNGMAIKLQQQIILHQEKLLVVRREALVAVRVLAPLGDKASG